MEDLLPPSIFPSISVFSNESVLHIRGSKYWSFSFSISTDPPTPPHLPRHFSGRTAWAGLDFSWPPGPRGSPRGKGLGGCPTQ